MVPPVATNLPAAEVERTWKTAQSFEAMALNEFLKPMFDTADMSSTPFGGGEAEEQWKPMMVDALAKQITAAGGVGLAKSVFTQMIHMQEAKGSEP